MTVSVAIATYNGSEYLEEQLKSILDQTTLPDEVIICDDGSSDSTHLIIKTFLKKAPFKVKFYENPLRLGYAKNFEKAIFKCVSDLIFLSDQDDIWHKDKIKTVVDYFNSDNRVMLIVHDAEIVTADGVQTGLTVANQIIAQGLSTDQLLLGCCMAFRAKLKPIIIPVPHLTHGHDGWINTIGCHLKCRKFIPEILQKYRRHSANTSTQRFTSTQKVNLFYSLKDKVYDKSLKNSPLSASVKRLNNINIVVDRITSRRPHIESILSNGDVYSTTLADLENIRQNYISRLNIQKLPLSKRLLPCARFYMTGGYRLHDGILSLIRDIFFK